MLLVLLPVNRVPQLVVQVPLLVSLVTVPVLQVQRLNRQVQMRLLLLALPQTKSLLQMLVNQSPIIRRLVKHGTRTIALLLAL